MGERLLPHRGQSRRRCVRSGTAAKAGLPPRARRVCPRPGEANVPRALAGLACQATASWPCKGGVSGNSGVISYLAGTPFRRQITSRRRTDVTAPMATAPGRARQEAPPGTEGTRCAGHRRPVVACGAESPAERPWTAGPPGEQIAAPRADHASARRAAASTILWYDSDGGHLLINTMRKRRPRMPRSARRRPTADYGPLDRSSP